MVSEKLSRACHHEAGHALLAFIEDVQIVSVYASEAGCGKVVPVDIASADPRAILRIAHAGEIAEHLAWDGQLKDPSGSDQALALEAKKDIPGQNHLALDNAAMDEVRAALRSHEARQNELAAFICDRHNREIPWEELEPELRRLFGHEGSS